MGELTTLVKTHQPLPIMKPTYYLLFVMALCLTFSNSVQSCTATTQYPANVTVTDSSSMNAITITTCNYAGEYAVVVLNGSFTYTFESSIATDFIEITNTSNTTLNTGTGTVSINNSGTDTVRMHIFTNSACSTQSTCRTTTVTRAPCLATVQFPTYVDTASNTYDTHFVSTCNYPGQFYEIVLFAGSYEIASSDTSDIFVFTDSANNVFFSQQTPVIANVTTTNYLKIRVHIFTDAFCGTEFACRTTTVKRLPCVATTQYPTYTIQASNDPALDTITNCNYAGEYIVIDIDSGQTYEVSSDSADWFFLTLTDDTYLSSGQTAFSFTNPYGDTTVRLHVFRDSACGEISACRQTYVQCLTCPVPIPTISSSDSVACLADLPVTLTNDDPFVGEVYWYSGTCASTPIDSGVSIQVSPSTTTTFYCANSFENQLSFCDSFTLEVFPSPFVSIGNITNVLCFGETSGSATATGSAGLAPYTYSWSNGEDSTYVDQLAAGQLSILLMDDNGCYAYDTIQITQPDAIQDSVFNKVEPLCYGDETGGLGILISGGVTPYTYSWSNSETTSSIANLGHGTYMLTLTDNNGCEEVYSYDIIAPEKLENDMEITDVWCQGDSNGVVQTDVEGGVGLYDYTWSTGDTNTQLSDLFEGDYILTITDINGCTLLDTASVSYIHENPTILMDSTEIICVEQTAILDAGAGFIYAWSTNQSTQSIEISDPGTYSVTVTDFNGCSSSKDVLVTLDSCLGITNVINMPSHRIYPNPSNGTIHFEVLSIDHNLETIQLESISGQVIKTIPISGVRSGVLDFMDVAKGVYIINLEFDNGISSEQIIIQ